MMRRFISAIVVAAMTLSSSPLFAAARAAQAQGAGSISGTATGAGGTPLARTTVQLRNLGTGQLAGTTTSGAAGQFTFTGLPAGNYAVEVVNASGQIIGTSASISVGAGAAVTGVVVTGSAASGAGAAGGAAAGGAKGGGVSTAVIITTVAAAAGIAGAVAIAKNGSPSR
jgi:hypothetical protein